ncbi:hypothetical protein LptCag_0551 [Leptospirillum ferriphilum]|uniref:Uncharacterized protein n=2 Tax=Leptospirillum ferriphilum TaxID=178606 RepID=A0A094WBN6_9BACT|nr:hypothetical protein LFML04_1984 [Leptospirillum ferriphilum ML-04]KGA93925.1 hypothetical protein LptCag_0551 [Leptospirillum ferriphilum]
MEFLQESFFFKNCPAPSFVENRSRELFLLKSLSCHSIIILYSRKGMLSASGIRMAHSLEFRAG